MLPSQSSEVSRDSYIREEPMEGKSPIKNEQIEKWEREISHGGSKEHTTKRREMLVDASGTEFSAIQTTREI